MIEMKDLQEGGSFGDGDMEEFVASMEIRSVENGDLEECQPEGPATGLGGLWRQRRRHENKQSRSMVILMGTFLLVAIVYVVGTVYMSDDSVDALVQPFDRESGFVENGSENEKEQAVIDNANHINQDHSANAHWGGKQNPFASTVNGNQRHHQNQGDASQGGAGYLGHDGERIGNKRPGKFGHHQGTIFNTGQQESVAVAGSDHSSSSGVSVNNDDTTANRASPAQPDVNDVDEKDVYCEDLSRYQSWYDAAVTKESGPQFRVVKQYDHDRRAFTYVLLLNAVIELENPVICCLLVFSQVVSLSFS
jgi:hypothetical protein